MNTQEFIVPEGITDLSTFHLPVSTNGIKTLTLPRNYTKLNRHDLSWCQNIKTLNVGPFFCEFDKYSLEYLKELEEINVDKENPFLESIDGIVYSKNKTKLIAVPRNFKGEVRISEGVTCITSNMFYKCQNITSLILPSSLRSIDWEAFYGIGEIKNPIYIPKGVTRIGTPIKYPKIPSSLYFEVDKDNPFYSSEDGILYNKDKSSLLYIRDNYTGSYTFPSNLTYIEYFCLEHVEVSSFVIPRGLDLTPINRKYNGIFASCPKLEHFYFEDTSTLVKESYFDDGITSDASKKYERFISFASSFYPKQLTSKARKLLLPRVCSLLYERNGELTEEWISEWKKVLKNSHKKLYKELIENIVMLAVMIDNSFLSLEDVKILIEESNKYGKTETTSLLLEYENNHFSFEEILKEKEKDLVSDVFSTTYLKSQYATKKNEDDSLTITSYKGDDKDIVLPDRIGTKRVTRIGSKAFSPLNNRVSLYKREKREEIQKITIPDGLKHISIDAFHNMYSLTQLKLPKGLILEGKRELSHRKPGLLYGCEKLTDITLPENMETLPDSTFEQCGYLKNITIPKGIKSIGNNCFWNCSSLEKIAIPNGVETIGFSAFRNCTSLSSVTLPSTLDRIRSYAFFNTPLLESIIVPPSVKHIGEMNFNYKDKFNMKVINNSYAHGYAIDHNIDFSLV